MNSMFVWMIYVSALQSASAATRIEFNLRFKVGDEKYDNFLYVTLYDVNGFACDGNYLLKDDRVLNANQEYI